MVKLVYAAVAAGLAGTSALAGGVERSTQSVAILFEKGRYAEFSLGSVASDVSGNLGGVFSSGDMAGNYVTYSLGYKQALRDDLDLAIILDQPIGAKVDYPAGGIYPLRGTTAELDSKALTALLRYKLPSQGKSAVSVYGGLRLESVSGNVGINTFPPVSGIPVSYALDTDTSYKAGYVLGLAWERPDIAARVAITYNSSITHSLAMTETSTVGLNATTDQKVEIPQSVNVEFQTGVAKDTLLFGSVRWVDWTAFQIAPPVYNTIFGPRPLVNYQHDRVTYTLGLGRKFNDSWSGAVTVAYEPSNDDVTGNLGPTDGYTSIGLGATYTHGNMKISGGVRYIDIGGADTTITARFRDNSGIAAGVKVAFSF